ncbi:unnamed protein product [Microthlaspi erraticum]|uniref:TF-B3 domain-containing protein n=1 Tax=Microthlaspi erraticum TaxID=1685480 RepID=A0A6D2JFJ6_9BRAS|nr:unnamed protein product [Microthlaspi erraticum]
MIQNPQSKPQEFLSLGMPQLSTSETNCSFDIKSSEKPMKVSDSEALCSYDETWPCGNPKKRKWNNTQDSISCEPSDKQLTKEERNIARMRFLSSEEKAEEERYGVSTELTLSITDQWTIKKVLTTKDLGQLSRLFLQTRSVQDHIIKHLDEDDQEKVQEGSGVTVKVYDHDTKSTHELLLRRLDRDTPRDYILNGGWRMYFVRRRGLRKGDKIGLFWDPFASKLHFRVLYRAATLFL